jgi:hypothetical protein
MLDCYFLKNRRKLEAGAFGLWLIFLDLNLLFYGLTIFEEFYFSKIEGITCSYYLISLKLSFFIFFVFFTVPFSSSTFS